MLISHFLQIQAVLKCSSGSAVCQLALLLSSCFWQSSHCWPKMLEVDSSTISFMCSVLLICLYWNSDYCKCYSREHEAACRWWTLTLLIQQLLAFSLQSHHFYSFCMLSSLHTSMQSPSFFSIKRIDCLQVKDTSDARWGQAFCYIYKWQNQ